MLANRLQGANSVTHIQLSQGLERSTSGLPACRATWVASSQKSQGVLFEQFIQILPLLLVHYAGLKYQKYLPLRTQSPSPLHNRNIAVQLAQHNTTQHGTIALQAGQAYCTRHNILTLSAGNSVWLPVFAGSLDGCPTESSLHVVHPCTPQGLSSYGPIKQIAVTSACMLSYWCCTCNRVTHDEN